MGQQDILEINGRQYDAKTGALLGESRIHAVPKTGAAQGRHQGRAVDGFVRKAASFGQAPKAHAAAIQASPKQPSTHHHAAKQHPVSMLKAHQPERPKTLMRRIVHKPDVTMKPALKAVIPSEVAPRTASDVAIPLQKKLSASQVNPFRLARANQVAKSHHIRRFDKNGQPIAADIAVKPMPVVVGDLSPKKQSSPAARPSTSPSKALQLAAGRIVSKRRSEALFSDALAKADSHEQPAYKPKKSHNVRRRFISITAGVAALGLITGFILYLNMPAMELKLASMHAGFQAEIPSYKPDGYSLENGIRSGNGQVELTYHSGTNTYTVTQVASNWDSNTLLDQSIQAYGRVPTKTLQSAGRSVYVYKDMAEWVNGGVKYTVNGNGVLSERELVSLANSL